jgi:hypothetical protein
MIQSQTLLIGHAQTPRRDSIFGGVVGSNIGQGNVCPD